MKLILSIASISLAAGLLAPAASAQPTPPPAPVAPPRARSAQVITAAETPYLGIMAVDITADRAKALKLREERGVELTHVDPESAAAKAGLKEGDVILEYNGQNVEGWEQLRRMVSETPIHREVKIGIVRNGSAQTVTATVGSHKDTMTLNGMVMPGPGGGMPFKIEPPVISMAPSIAMPEFHTFIQNRSIGFMGEPLNQDDQLAEFFGVKSGVLIRSVTKNSAAEKAGLKAGDVLTKIDDTAVSRPGEINNALRAAGSRKTLNFTVVRNKKEISLPVTIEPGMNMRGGLWTQDGWVLDFPSYDGIIQGTEKGSPKIIWQ